MKRRNFEKQLILSVASYLGFFVPFEVGSMFSSFRTQQEGMERAQVRSELELWMSSKDEPEIPSSLLWAQAFRQLKLELPSLSLVQAVINIELVEPGAY